ncbi:MAG: ORF6N domain-containing protein [Sediminibacterium magnilacihabitans]|jgi:hypothetical protein|nr:ORF6N domain-containing protein [Sediminibacterium magnilacihabitans]PQV62332.1 ORF6N domain-containing protein [Sediminibacterium magnilacihabitans]
MDNEIIVSESHVISKIYLVRGQKVMLDRDLADIYGVETKRLNEQVKRNQERFPQNFMFQLTDQEVEILMSQIATSRLDEDTGWGGRRKLPYAFTEYGVLMLANVLKSARAVAVSIKIIDIFVRLREALLANQDMLLKLEQLDKKMSNIGHDVKMHDGEIETIFELIKEIMEERMRPKPRTPIGFKPQA